MSRVEASEVHETPHVCGDSFAQQLAGYRSRFLLLPLFLEDYNGHRWCVRAAIRKTFTCGRCHACPEVYRNFPHEVLYDGKTKRRQNAPSGVCFLYETDTIRYVHRQAHHHHHIIVTINQHMVSSLEKLTMTWDAHGLRQQVWLSFASLVYHSYLLDRTSFCFMCLVPWCCINSITVITGINTSTGSSSLRVNRGEKKRYCVLVHACDGDASIVEVLLVI